VILQLVRVGSAADDRLAARTQLLRFLSLTQSVIEDDDVGPRDVRLPVVRLRHKAVGDVLLLLVGDEVADLVALLDDLPGDVADQARERDEEEFASHDPPRAGTPFELKTAWDCMAKTAGRNGASRFISDLI